MPWASYQIRKIAGCACAGNAGNVFPRRRFQRKPVVNDPGMHHSTCVTNVLWCMSGSLTCGDGENVPGACAPAISRIWQEAHIHELYFDRFSGFCPWLFSFEVGSKQIAYDIRHEAYVIQNVAIVAASNEFQDISNYPVYKIGKIVQKSENIIWPG